MPNCFPESDNRVTNLTSFSCYNVEGCPKVVSYCGISYLCRMTLDQLTTSLRTALTGLYDGREAAWIARVVMEYHTGKNRTDLLLHGSDEASPLLAGMIDEARARLLAGEPVQYLLGEAWFHGLTLKVDRSTLIPRPETAQLVDVIEDRWQGRSDLRVLDICTGSGCIALALARDLPFASVTATDISPEALAVASSNATRLRIRNLRFVQSDILKDPFPTGPWDIVVSNPPYVLPSESAMMSRSVLDFEPHGALFVPETDPLIFYRRIAAEALPSLAGGGRIYFEINPLEADAMLELMNGLGYAEVTVETDAQGRKRFIIAARP